MDKDDVRGRSTIRQEVSPIKTERQPRLRSLAEEGWKRVARLTGFKLELATHEYARVSEHRGGGNVNREDWTLLAVAAAEGEPLTPVQLQKVLFLLGKHYPRTTGPEFYHFSPYNYGPFSQRIYSDADALASQGLLRVSRRPGQNFDEYAITPHGVERARRLPVAEPASKYLKDVVAWARKLSFRELVSAIYSRYPEQRVNSVFR